MQILAYMVNLVSHIDCFISTTILSRTLSFFRSGLWWVVGLMFLWVTGLVIQLLPLITGVEQNYVPHNLTGKKNRKRGTQRCYVCDVIIKVTEYTTKHSCTCNAQLSCQKLNIIAQFIDKIDKCQASTIISKYCGMHLILRHYYCLLPLPEQLSEFKRRTSKSLGG